MNGSVATAVLLALFLGAAASSAAEPTISLMTSDDPQLTLGTYAVPGGRPMKLGVGIGSSAFRRKDAPDGLFVTVSDRGPNIECDDIEDALGVKPDKLCREAKNGRVFPFPDYSPSIYRVKVDADRFSIVATIPLRDASGKPLSGLPNPRTGGQAEAALDGQGKRLELQTGAVDVEAVVEMADGTFWIGEENGPSILNVAADGRVLKRYVPKGTEAAFATAGYPVEGLLPAIFAKRATNRGIEALAVSPDDRFLYLTLQSPLANPDNKTYQQARNVRLLKIDLQTMRLVAEHVYPLSPIAEFKGEERKNQSTARISEMTALDLDRLLILERTDKTTKIFAVDLRADTDILGSSWDEPRQLPSLEQITLDAAAIKPATKRQVLDSTTYPKLPTKIEGMALFANGDLMLVNDDDFGIEGQRTTIARISGLRLLD